MDDFESLEMNRRCWSILFVVWIALSAVSFAFGGVVVTSYWADAMHLIDIADRMAQGQVPHLDFVTPIGALAFAPISALMSVGVPTGQAFLISQVLLSGVLTAAAMALAVTRMPVIAASLFAGFVMVTVLALTHGRPELTLSINVHYNRWAWGLAFLALLAATLPPGRNARWEGVLLGSVMAALAMLKVTVFVGVLPVVILGLVLTGQTRTLFIGTSTGLAIAALLTAFLGVDYWLAYLSDLIYVAAYGARPNAGHGVLHVLTGPQLLIPSVLVCVAIAWLWHGRQRSQAVLLFCVFLSGASVANQNAGSDPLFLGVAALLLFVWAQDANESQRAVLLGIGIAFAMAMAPNVANLATSPVRTAFADRANLVPLIIGSEQHRDVLTDRVIANMGGKQSPFLDGQRKYFDPPPLPVVEFKGERIELCRTEPSSAYFASIAAELAEHNVAQGQPIFVADYLSAFWLFGNHPPLKGAAPWSYGGVPGLENADYVLLPVCPNRVAVTAMILLELEDVPMTEHLTTPLFRLYKLD